MEHTKPIRRFKQQDLRVLEKKPLYQGFFSMHQYRFQHATYNGGISDIVCREIFERGHAVGLLPYDPITDEFVLIEQVRIAAAETSESPWLIEIIAGIIDAGESELDVCVREAKEEAGIDVNRLYKACSYLSSPGGTTERLHIYMALTDSSVAKGVHGLAHESEDILVHRVPAVVAREWLNSGVIDNGAAIIALQWFFLNQDTLRSHWGID